MIDAGHKKCCGCKKIKPFSGFQDSKRRYKQKTYLYRDPYCRDCKTIQSREYRKQHPDRRKKAVKKWVNNNPEKAAAIKLAWAQKNPDKIKKNCLKWVKNNPDKVRENSLKWRQSARGRIKGKQYKAKRKQYGYIPLNEFFNGSVGHHIDNNRIVFIPESVHLQCYAGQYTERHRALVVNFYNSIENMVNNVIPREVFLK